MDPNADATPLPPKATEGAAGKYIRTFAGDMDAMKKGGTPDLTPLSPVPKGAARPPALQNVVVAKPTATAPAAHTQAPAPILPPITLPPPVTKSVAQKNPPLQTYANDFLQRMKATHASTATILAAEQDNAPRLPRAALQGPPHISLPYSIAGTVLLLASIVGGYVAYMHYRTTATPVAPVPIISTPIFVDEREEISGTGPALLLAITDSVNRPLSVGAVRLLFSLSTTNTINIFSLLSVSAPDALLRNMDIAGSMAGVIHVDGAQSPFFILSVSSYSTVFSGMLSWEPLMPEYFAELFPLNVSQSETSGEHSALQNVAASSTASTTTATVPKSTKKTPNAVAPTTPTTPVFIAGFYDVVIANHDVRAYRDTLGRDVLLYGFWDQSTLIIARDAAAFTEIASRLATARSQ